jgi:regulator of replication initiation timing
MTAELDDMRASLIAAVQAELDRYGATMMAEVERLRSSSAADREALRQAFGEQLQSLAAAVEQSHTRNEQFQHAMRQAIDTRLGELESRTTRRFDDMDANLAGMVQDVARPALQEIRDDQTGLIRRIEALDSNLRRFDEQAARMVTYFNEMTQAMEQRTAELSEQLQTNVEGRLSTLTVRFDELESATRRTQTETAQMVGTRLSDIEDRLNERVLAAEVRVKEDSGTRIAEIDAHVGRVTAGLDTTLIALNDRMSGLDSQFEAIDDRIETLREEMNQIDSKELDELREKLSTAIGEAVLVRIEMERLEKSLAERFDTVALRVTDVETQLADATADVSTAVQLERLEELERAVIEIDPNKFVTRSEFQQTGPVRSGAPLDPPTLVD